MENHDFHGGCDWQAKSQLKCDLAVPPQLVGNVLFRKVHVLPPPATFSQSEYPTILTPHSIHWPTWTSIFNCSHGCRANGHQLRWPHWALCYWPNVAVQSQHTITCTCWSWQLNPSAITKQWVLKPFFSWQAQTPTDQLPGASLCPLWNPLHLQNGMYIYITCRHLHAFQSNWQVMSAQENLMIDMLSCTPSLQVQLIKADNAIL